MHRMMFGSSSAAASGYAGAIAKANPIEKTHNRRRAVKC